MKMSSKRILAVLCVLALTVGLLPAALAARPMGDEAVETAPTAAAVSAPSGSRTTSNSAVAEEKAGLSAAHTVWIVGDSTVCHYDHTPVTGDDTSYYYKRLGYGDMVGTYLADSTAYEVKNIALSGRSSKSFVTDPDGGKAAYDDMIAKITTGDIMIIGWGHNDEKSDDANRYTTVPGNWEVEGSFANSLWTRYVKPALDKGATPIICTPIVRRDGSNSYSDNSSYVHYANGGSYAAAAIQLGQDKNVPVVDLTTLTRDKWKALGTTENAKLHAWTSDAASSVDNTHLNKYGAKWVAYLLAKSILESEDAAITNGLKAVFSLDAGEPTATDLANAATVGWTKPAYTRPTKDSTNFTPYPFTNQKTNAEDSFKGTVFGTLGGAGNVTKGTLCKESDTGFMHIAGPVGSKIADSNDGFSMYYYAVPAGSTFKMTATVIVNSLDNADTQTAFGLMARDDIYIDTQNDQILSNYVAAGVLTRGTSAGTANCFYRKDNVLKNKSVYTDPMIKTGDVLELSLVKDSDGVTCAIEGQTPQSGGFDISLTAVDTEYMYVGPFANRKSDVTFLNLYLEIDGEVICNLRQTQNTITVPTAEHGTASANMPKAGAGTPIQLTATPDKGYVLDNWTVKDADNGAVTVDGNLSFTMPAKAVTATPSFMPIPTAWNFGTDATLTGATNGTTVAAGKNALWKGLTISGQFSTTTSGKATVAKDTTIRVPLAGSAKVTLTAEAAGKFSINGTPMDATSKTLSVLVESGKDGYAEIKALDAGALTGITVAPDSTIAAHTVTLTASPAEGGTPSASTENATEGTLVRLTPGPASGYDFDQWTVTAGGVTVTDNAFVMPNANVAITGTFKSGARKVENWDFAGAVMSESTSGKVKRNESDADTYLNRITAETILDSTKFSFSSNGKLASAKTVSFGDLTLNYRANDRIYSNVNDAVTTALGGSGNHGKALNPKDFEDGYKSVGGLYGNGASKSTSAFYAQLDNVKAGDTLIAYAGEHQSGLGTVDFTWKGLDAAAGQSVSMTCAAQQMRKLTLIAAKDGSYIFYNSGADKADTDNEGKPQIQRITRIPGVKVNGTLSVPPGKTIGSGWKLRFVNMAQELTYETDVATNGSYSVTLPVDVEFTAQLSGATGLGLAAGDGKVKTLTVPQAVSTTPVTWNLDAAEQSVITGTITLTGFAQSYDLSKLKVVLTPEKISGEDTVTLNATGNTATVTAENGVVSQVKYTVSLLGANDYAVAAAGNYIQEEGNFTKTITVQPVPTYAATGKFVTLDPDDLFAPLQEDAEYPALDATVTALKFKNLDDEYEYTATVENGGYSLNLRDGAYEASATVSGYRTKTHVVVDGGAVSKDILFKSTATPGAVTYAEDLYVNPKKADGTTTFKTVTGAVNYAARMTRSASDRVTIHIAPGTYREQVIVNTPNVTFINDNPAKEAKITWYYGVGCKYYSSSGNPITADTPDTAKPNAGYRGMYDPERAFDKYSKSTADRWGCTVQVKQEGFRAENVTFENSFNYTVTDEELVDGVAPSGIKESMNVIRNYSTDVTSKAATERGAAMECSANKAEFYKCKFLSSQDTLYTGGTIYFKDCFIEGMTDYIFGGGSCVFDTCQLNWKGYSGDKPEGGAVTASKPSGSDKGYLLRSCAITADNDLTTGAGLLGRAWGGDDAAVIFLNTTFASADMIGTKGWSTMSGTDIPNTTNKVKEYGSALADGTPVSTSGRPSWTVMDAAAAAAVDVATYFGSWVPDYYTAEDNTVAFSTEPSLSSNDDLNAPLAGNTLFVGYSLGAANDANDASLIQWYRVKQGQDDVLVKSAPAYASKSYKLTEADRGFNIKVKVTPAVTSGKKAAALTATTDYPVAMEGYSDPDEPTADPTLGDGINIFLAGDSTVKDYTTINDGKGSWGEYLQKFFDEKKVTVVNHANGGRSTRNFINEGSLANIAKDIKAGDYLFIQFGHNDGYTNDMLDRYVAVGTPDNNGIYPTTPAQKYSTPSGLSDQLKQCYGAEMYTWNVGGGDGTTPNGTYKWYLKQYIDVAKTAGAIPVLITPVARLNYDASGKITLHHKAGNEEPNSYVIAMKQLAEEEDVLLIDGFELTKGLLDPAGAASKAESKAVNTYGKQLMCQGDDTHYNKLGGFLTAAAIAEAVQDLKVNGAPINIAKTVKAPASVLGVVKDNDSPVFQVSAAGKLTAYDITAEPAYSARATYWEPVGQAIFDSIAAKAEALNTPAQEEVKSMGNVTVKDDNDQDVEVELKITVKWTGDAEADEDRDPVEDREEIGTATVNINVPAEETIFAACWDEDDVFLGVKALRGDVQKVALERGWSRVKLIWAADEKTQPKCAYAEVKR